MFKRALVEGLKNITRSFWLSVTAVSVLTVSFFSVALVVVVTSIVGFAVRNLDTLVSIPAFVQNEFPEEQIPEILAKVEAIPEVGKVEYFDRERAKQNLEQGQTGFSAEFIESLSSQEAETFIWRFVRITPKTSEDYGVVIEKLKAEEYVNVWDRVYGDQDFVNRLIWLNDTIRWVSAILVVVFALISLLVMVNILRITIYNYKEEIEIMRLVGATNNYIRAPFIAEGVYYNLFAALIVTAVFIPGFRIILPNIQAYIGPNLGQSSAELIWQTYFTYGLTIILGLIFGVMTSFMATRRYLKL